MLRHCAGILHMASSSPNFVAALPAWQRIGWDRLVRWRRRSSGVFASTNSMHNSQYSYNSVSICIIYYDMMLPRRSRTSQGRVSANWSLQPAARDRPSDHAHARTVAKPKAQASNVMLWNHQCRSVGVICSDVLRGALLHRPLLRPEQEDAALTTS